MTSRIRSNGDRTHSQSRRVFGGRSLRAPGGSTRSPDTGRGGGTVRDKQGTGVQGERRQYFYNIIIRDRTLKHKFQHPTGFLAITVLILNNSVQRRHFGQNVLAFNERPCRIYIYFCLPTFFLILSFRPNTR